MSWKDRYQQASFRGASFYVETAEGSHGRRQAVHEHAQRDVPYTEDMGRKAREFTIDGYVIGASYDIQLEALIEACETAGPGQLVHPYRGSMTVVCRGLKTRESNQDGGMGRVSITFLEAGDQSFPRALSDSVNAISGSGNSVTAAAAASMIERFITGGFPQFVRDSAAVSVKRFAKFLLSPGFNMSSDVQAASSFFYLLNDLISDADSLVTDTPKLVSRMTGVMTSVRSGYGSSSFDVLNALSAEFAAPYTGIIPTPSRKQEKDNFESFGEFVRQSSVAESAKQAVLTTYDSYQDAIAVRDTMLVQIDTESERTASDDAYYALNGLRNQIVRGIPKQGERLPQMLEYKPAMTMPALLLAHKLYGDASRDAEITSRNKPQHPGFLIGGKSLEVLADG